MAGPLAGAARTLACVLALTAGACASDAARIQEHQRKLRSLHATATSVTSAWLAGAVSDRSAGTVLERTFELTEEERQAIAATPSQMVRAEYLELARRADANARFVAALQHDAEAGDAASARRSLADDARGTAR